MHVYTPYVRAKYVLALTCSSNAHTFSAMNYRILVVGEGKHFGLSTACLYVTLAGEYGTTDVLEISRGEYQTETTVSHDNCTCALCEKYYAYMYIHETNVFTCTLNR